MNIPVLILAMVGELVQSILRKCRVVTLGIAIYEANNEPISIYDICD